MDRERDRAPECAQLPDRKFVTKLAAQLHAAWRSSCTSSPDGTGAHAALVDLPFSSLPAHWQQENLAAADAALAAVTNSRTLEEAATLVHVGWLARNGAWAPPAQQLAYAELAEDEKEKDRVVARVAAAALGITLN